MCLLLQVVLHKTSQEDMEQGQIHYVMHGIEARYAIRL